MPLAAAVAVLLVPTVASAQLSRLGGTVVTLHPGGIFRGVDSVRDPARDVYLSVTGYGVLYGVFTNAAGAPITGVFTIDSGANGFANFPRVAYSPDVAGGAGGFLVVWQVGFDSGPQQVRARTISYQTPGHLASSTQVLSDVVENGPRVESWPAVAYSRTSGRFMVVWCTSGFGLRGRTVDAGGNPIGSVFGIAAGAGSRDPSLAWNPSSNLFGLVNTAWGGSGAWTVLRTLSVDGVVTSQSSFGFAAGTFATAIDVNGSNQFVASWSLHPGVRSAIFSATGTLLGETFVDGNVGYDLSLGMAYNAGSNSFLVVSSDRGVAAGGTDEIAGRQLNSSGAPVTSLTVLTEGGTGIGSFYPQVDAGAGPDWNVAYSRGYGGVTTQIVRAGGGSSPTPPPPPSPSPSGCSTPDPFVSLGGGVCVNGGWLPPGSGGTSPGGCTTPQPAAGWVCVNGGWVPGSGTGSPSGGCSGPDPFASIGGGTCVNGGWVPGGSGGSSSGCSTPMPGAGWVCVNGGWVPGGGGGSSTSCTTPMPGAGWVCVNGGWVPGSMGGGCSSPDPFASIGGGVCVNGGWVPGSSAGAGGGGCTTPQPGAGWVCVNGGWIPGGGGSSTSCTTPMPGAGWICVNGGWIPGGGSTTGCTTPMPGAGWICVNGGWIPGGGGSTSGCTTPMPGAGWICVNGGWVPGSGVSTAGCSTPDPFASIGGGTCVNGGWVPRTGGCAGPDPFASIGGGICVNGGWVPRGQP